jgi:hypothetical protein
MFYIKTKERRYCKWFLLLETLPSLFTQETLKVFVAYWLALVVELEEEFFFRFVSFRHRRGYRYRSKEGRTFYAKRSGPSVRLFVRLFLCWFVRLFVRSFVDSFLCSFVDSFVLPVAFSFVCSFDCSFVCFLRWKNKSFRKFYVDCQYPVKWKYTISFGTSSSELTSSFQLLMKGIYLKIQVISLCSLTCKS